MNTLSPFTDPAQWCAFGRHSHWLQPHRSYALCPPVSAFLGGPGFNGRAPEQIKALGAAGFKHCRIEAGWNTVAWDESGLTNAADLSASLQACKDAGVRPLILMNANQGVPGPTRFASYTVTAPVAVGDKTLSLNTGEGLVIDHSGLTNVEGYTAADPVFTGVALGADGTATVTLSLPCPVALTAGQVIQVSTVEYEPWAAQGTAAFLETFGGFCRWWTIVALLCRSVLGPGGWDMEVWNELTFGSASLDAANYGLPGDGGAMIGLMPRLAATLAEGSPHLFDGVRLTDGMANTLPWEASSTEPARVTALSKHPYHGRNTWPADEVRPDLAVGYDGKPSAFLPSYTALLPEYFGTLLQTETALRDITPVSNDVFGVTEHGLNARPGGPVNVWLTEYAMGLGDGLDAAAIDKAFERAMAFWLGVGAERLYWFNGDGVTPGQSAWLSRVAAMLSAGGDASAPARAVSLLSVSETHGHTQWTGDGTPAAPDLLNLDCFAFFPFQISGTRWGAFYYVITRDVALSLPEEEYVLSLGGLSRFATFGAYDPDADAEAGVEGNAAALTVKATDRPRLLIIDDTPGVASQTLAPASPVPLSPAPATT